MPNVTPNSYATFATDSLPQVSSLKPPLRPGRDWEAELKQRAKEITLIRELGLPLESDSNNANTGEVKDDARNPAGA